MNYNKYKVPSRIFLIDLENVGRNGLSGIMDLTAADKVYVFHNAIHGTLPDFFGNQKPKCFFKVVSLYNHHAQALDFTLAAQFGATIASTNNPDCDFYIVSKDRGFESLQGFARACYGKRVTLAPSIAASFENLSERDQEKEREELEGIFPGATKKFLDQVQRALTNAETRHQYKLLLKKLIGSADADILPVYAKTRHLV